MELKELCRMTQKEMKSFLKKELEKRYAVVIDDDGFLYARGTMNVCLTSHMDTVYKEPPKAFIYNTQEDKLWSPQGIGGDDRCGIYMILKLLDKGFRPSIIFCEDEEIGCVGSRKFTKHKDLCEEVGNDCHYIIELDRRNSHDAVFYDCANEDFIEWVIENSGYTEAMGSVSDISYLCSETGIAGVNFSCGYYNEHRGMEEYVILHELENTLNMVEKLIQVETNEKFEYIEEHKYSYGYDYGYGYDFGMESEYIIKYYDKKTDDIMADYYYSSNEYEALGQFFTEHMDLCFMDIVDIEIF